DTEHWDAFGTMVAHKAKTGRLRDTATSIVDSVLERCRKFVLPKGTDCIAFAKTHRVPSKQAPMIRHQSAIRLRGSLPEQFQFCTLPLISKLASTKAVAALMTRFVSQRSKHWSISTRWILAMPRTEPA